MRKICTYLLELIKMSLLLVKRELADDRVTAHLFLSIVSLSITLEKICNTFLVLLIMTQCI